MRGTHWHCQAGFIRGFMLGHGWGQYNFCRFWIYINVSNVVNEPRDKTYVYLRYWSCCLYGSKYKSDRNFRLLVMYHSSTSTSIWQIRVIIWWKNRKAASSLLLHHQVPNRYFIEISWRTEAWWCTQASRRNLFQSKATVALSQLKLKTVIFERRLD